MDGSQRDRRVWVGLVRNEWIVFVFCEVLSS